MTTEIKMQVPQEIIDAHVRAAIEEAKAVFAEWSREKCPLIREAILKRLRGDEGTFVDTVADRLVEGVNSNFEVYCRMKVEN